METKLLVKRIFKGPKYTIGHLYLNEIWICNTMEDVVREFGPNGEGKIYGETAIPYGTYNVQMVYWSKHKNWYPLLMNVPFFTGIFIHGGVTEKDSEGCILVGYNKTKGQLWNSLDAMEQLRILLKNEDEITITIE